MRARRVVRPVRRGKPLHPPALLIDQNGRLAPERVAHAVGERPKLIRCLNIALEDDETPRVYVAEQSAFVCAQSKPCGVGNEGLGHGRGLSAPRWGVKAGARTGGSVWRPRLIDLHPCGLDRAAPPLDLARDMAAQILRRLL